MLHLITDTTIQDRFSHCHLARLAYEGGAPVVQYRNKHFVRRNDLEPLQNLAFTARKLGRTLIINDDVDLALEVGASGVHLGVEDCSPQKARELMGPDAVIGATVHNIDELAALQGLAIDYIGVGPVYGTRSKSIGLPDLGLENLKAICKASSFPVIAIGGITSENVLPILRVGAQGVAVLSAFCKSPEPSQFVKNILQILS